MSYNETLKLQKVLDDLFHLNKKLSMTDTHREIKKLNFLIKNKKHEVGLK